MAYRRALSARATILARRNHHHHHPSLTHILHRDHENDAVSKPASNQKRFFGNHATKASTFAENRRAASNAWLASPAGFAFARSLSTATGGGSDEIQVFSEAAMSNTAAEAVTSQLPAVSEVAAAAADSYLPVKALQYMIDYIHTDFGLSWWAAIVATTLVIRTIMIPLSIHQAKASGKLAILKPHLEKHQKEMQSKGMDLSAKLDYQKKVQALFREHGVSPFTPLKGIFIQAPVFISFFLAISNMAEKVPSFKNGGAFWFLDLSTPDALYIFPVLAGLSFLITIECNALEGMEGNSSAKTMKNVSRGMAVLTVPFTMGFPKAIFCYWITTNVFSLCYGQVIKIPRVRKTLGIPKLLPPAPQPEGSQQSAFALFKQLAAPPQPASSTVQASKIQIQKTSTASDLSQRIKTLEKKVKGRKRNKKR